MQGYSAGLSHVGCRRWVNEDAFYCDDTLGLYVVADGMGGHAGGEVASREAVRIVREMITQRQLHTPTLSFPPTPKERKELLRLMESAVQAATYFVFALAENQPEHQGMGTTLSALFFAGSVGAIAQVGDSRIYRFRDGKLDQLTQDHTLVAWQVEQGLISADEARVAPHRNVITRAVGSQDYVQVDTALIELKAGDVFLLCSDGLHDYLEDGEADRILEGSPEEASQRFIELACERGGKDNITAIIVDTQNSVPRESGTRMTATKRSHRPPAAARHSSMPATA